MQGVRAWCAHAAAALSEAGVENAALDARLMVQHVLSCTHAELVAQPERTLSDEVRAALNALLARRCAREPLAYLLGGREFYGLPFYVSRHTLIPRPDSETLIDAVLARVNKDAAVHILDLGTGSGCLLLTLLSQLKNAHGIGVDVSEKALDIAKKNAENLGLSERVEWRSARWCEGLQKKVEIVVANPPYIPSNDVRHLMPEVVRYEPASALDGGEDGLDCYREIARQLPQHVTKPGLVVLEVGIGQDAAVSEIFCAAGFSVDTVLNDLSGIPRCVIASHR